ncbi:MAG TPA: hypothetical protein VHE12_11240 [bacterium]|nr:hypothetical protein [bacterium]
MTPKTIPFLRPFALAAAFVGSCHFFWSPLFMVNDDWWSVFITQGSGFSIHPDEHLVFSNVLLGSVLKWLNMLVPALPWFTFLLLAALIHALGCWGLAIELGGQEPGRLFLYLLLLIQIGIYFFLKLNYSMIAGLEFQAGTLLFLRLFTDPAKTPRRATSWLGASCFAACLLLRWKAFVAWSIFLFPLIAMGAWRARKDPRDRHLLGLTTLSLAAIFAFHYLYFHSDPEWREFYRFTYRSAELVDWGTPIDPRSAPSLFGAAGVTSNDLAMFKDWYFLDPAVTGPNGVEKLKPLFKHESIDLASALGPITRFPLARCALICVLALLALRRPKGTPLILFQLLWIIAACLGFLYFLRLPDRMLYPSYFLAAALPLYFPSRWVQSPSRVVPTLYPWSRPILTVILVLSALYSIRQFRPFERFCTDHRDKLYAELERLAPTNDQLFIIWDSQFPFEDLDPYRGFGPFRRSFHFFPFGNFETSPLALGTLVRFGIHRPLEDMVDRPDVFLICSPQEGEMYQTYMRERHHQEIYIERYFLSLPFNVYRIHSKPFQLRTPDPPKAD